MPNFTFSPTGGTGSYFGQDIVCTPAGVNGTYADKVTKAVINGVSAVTLTHFGKPIMVLSSGATPVPAVGGVLSYEIRSHYDFAFYNIPSGFTISDSNGRTYVEEARYPASYSEGAEFYVNVPANEETTAKTFTIRLRHYYPSVNGVLSNNYYDVTINQEAGSASQKYINLSPSTLVWDWDDTSAKTVTVSSNVSWTAALVSNHYEIVGSSAGTNNGTVTIRPTDANNTSSNRFETVLSFNGESGVTTGASLTHYRRPSAYLAQGEGETIDPTGGTRHISIVSDYEWWFYPNPNYPNQHIKMYTDDNKTTQIVPIPWESSKSLPIVTEKTYTFTWEANGGNVKNDAMAIRYTRLDGTTGDGYENYVGFQQGAAATPQIQVSPSVLVFDWWEDSATTKQIQVTTEMGGDWTFATNHDFGEFTCVKNGHYLDVTPTAANSSTALGSSSKKHVNITFTHTSDSAVTASATTEHYSHPSVNTEQGVSLSIPATGATKGVWINSDYYWWVITNFDPQDEFSTELNGSAVTIVHNEASPSDLTAPTTVGGDQYDFIFFNNPTTNQIPYNGQGYFEIRYKDREGNTRTDGGTSFGWRQDGAQSGGYIEVIPEKYSVSAERSLSECQFAVSASTSWTASTQDSWIAVVRASTAGDSGYSDDLKFIIMASNTGSTVRDGSIVITGGTASATLAVSQDAASWGASEHNFSLSSGATGGQSPSTTITAASSWTAQTADAWIHILTSSGNAGSVQLYFYADSNSTGSRRYGEIDIVSGGETKVKIYVGQDA